MKYRLIFPLFLCMTLMSCMSSQIVSVQNSNKQDPNIEIYLRELNSPKRDYEIVSYIEVSGSVFASKSALLNTLKKKASKLGGDAVVNVNYFYIPWVFSSLPAVEGVVIKFK